MKTLLASLTALAVFCSTQAHTDEAISRQIKALQTSMSSYKNLTDGKITTIDNNISAITNNLNAVTTRIQHMETCSRKSMIYSPGAPGVDRDNCLTVMTSQTVDDRHRMTVENMVCTRGGFHARIAKCPPGYVLTGCSGGAGDLHEDNEFFKIRPSAANNSCNMHVNNPACFSSASGSYVSAFCVESASSFTQRAGAAPSEPDHVNVWTLPANQKNKYQ